MRRHGNHAEYVALALVLLAVCELGGGSATALHALGGAFTLGRVAHAIGVGIKPSAPRAVGALLTWVALAGAGVYGAVLAFSGADGLPRALPMPRAAVLYSTERCRAPPRSLPIPSPPGRRAPPSASPPGRR